MEQTAPPLRTLRQETILVTAERLFADHGFHGVTLRQIADAARVPLALVGYYFGRKHDLFRAVFHHRAACHHARLATIDEARRHAREAQGLLRIVEAFVLPLVHLRHNPSTAAYARLLARELQQGSPVTEHPMGAGFDPLVQRFMLALGEAVPTAGPTEIAWGCQFTLGAVALHMRDRRIEQLLPGGALGFDRTAAPRLVAYAVSGLAAVLHGDGATDARAQP
ncbi:MAG: TetR/AcrR family transcriptional regulator [Hydrogenophaga sp.]|uniref:TetR/AcrR family transcriptional regulator n=1 Tax=Hydrogenophaga sp. TaxID=1904254 RepID=UPI0025804151|nr:TetR/AcrR family transcriptional regulator [Hydrogenophaga sp.]MBL0943814.1 TetR/AcrR family transcriptional regulator [Hydrogenophaga sp.]